MIYTDFSKAFNRIHHGLLLRKLTNIGLPNDFMKWLTSYLTDRVQNVKLESSISKDITVYSGVPQGSHLGPILFALYVNDLCNELVNCEFLFYADDLKIFKRIDNLNDVSLLQNNLLTISSWCKDNFMQLNITKCKVITFSRKRTSNRLLCDYAINEEVIKRCTRVLLDEKVNMNEHVDNICKKAMKIFALVKR